EYRLVNFPSLNGRTLYGMLMFSPSPPKGVGVPFYGNFGNLSNHFPLSVFFVKNGFDVLIFDYLSYCAFHRRSNPENQVEDGLAAVRYAYEFRRNRDAGVAILGQSLGGAVGIVVAAKDPRVKAVVIEAAFAGYRSMARKVLGRHIITWPLYPIAP